MGFAPVGAIPATNAIQPMTSLNSKLQLALINRKKGRNLLEKGFTLVELMIVIVIVGVLSAVALPNFLNQTSKAKGTECTSLAGSMLSEVAAEALQSETDASALLTALTGAATPTGTNANSVSEVCTFAEVTLSGT